MLCPYCGHRQLSQRQCECCGGLFEPLSRAATQINMGPWFVRNDQRPFLPGFSYEIVKKQVRAGRIDADSVLRGPTTHQFWARALDVPGVAHLLGQCHACQAPVRPDLLRCPRCQVPFILDDQPDGLGLMYPTPDSRRQAEAEIETQRIAPPPATEQPAPSNPAAAPSPTEASDIDVGQREVEVRLPAVSEPILESASAVSVPDTSPALPPTETAAFDPTETSAPAAASSAPAPVFDLWETQGTRARPPRPPQERTGLGTTLLGLGLLGLIAGGVALAIFYRPPPTPDPAAERQAQDRATAARRAALSARIAQLEVAWKKIKDVEVTDETRPLLDQVNRGYSGGQADLDAGRFEPLDHRLTVADGALQQLNEIRKAQLAERRRMQALLDTREETESVAKQVAVTAREAKAQQAPTYASKLWESAGRKQKVAQGHFARDDHAAARRLFEEALSDYERALSLASAGAAGREAGAALTRHATARFTRARMARHGGQAWKQIEDLEQAGEKAMRDGYYTDALEQFEEARALVPEAEAGVQARVGARFYALTAGYQVADTLLARAAGKSFDRERRDQLIVALGVLGLPEANLQSIPDAADVSYPLLARVLVLDTRKAMTEHLDPRIQPCYNVGFQFRIVQQVLAAHPDVLPPAALNEIRKSLLVIRRDAEAAGFVEGLGKFLDHVSQRLAKPPTTADLKEVRDTWQYMVERLSGYRTAIDVLGEMDASPPA